jgi:hypothetical protein
MIDSIAIQGQGNTNLKLLLMNNNLLAIESDLYPYGSYVQWRNFFIDSLTSDGFSPLRIEFTQKANLFSGLSAITVDYWEPYINGVRPLRWRLS